MPSNEILLGVNKTALVLIDLQKGITSSQTSPYASDVIVENAARIAARFRELKALVVLVRVAFSKDGGDRLSPKVDSPMTSPGARPEGWDEIDPRIGVCESDLVIIKKQWGAFYGTELDLQLRRRGITTIVIGGIATNYGVESTARDAYERGYQLIFVEDAMGSMKIDLHQFAITHIFPRIGLIRRTEDILKAMS
jgi:nicotinamidase-related amidase